PMTMRRRHRPSSTARHRDCPLARAADRGCISSAPPATRLSRALAILPRLCECRGRAPPDRGGSRRSPRGAAAAIRPHPAQSACGSLWRFRAARATSAARRSRCAVAVVSSLNPCIDYSRSRHRKREADDAGEPLVEIVLVLRFLGLHHLGGALAGHEFCPPAPGEVAGEFGVPIILELLDLVRRPALRHADQRVGDRAFGEVIELPELTAQQRDRTWKDWIATNSSLIE